jgi:hypothetical protein
MKVLLAAANHLVFRPTSRLAPSHRDCASELHFRVIKRGRTTTTSHCQLPHNLPFYIVAHVLSLQSLRLITHAHPDVTLHTSFACACLCDGRDSIYRGRYTATSGLLEREENARQTISAQTEAPESTLSPHTAPTLRTGPARPVARKPHTSYRTPGSA